MTWSPIASRGSPLISGSFENRVSTQAGHQRNFLKPLGKYSREAAAHMVSSKAEMTYIALAEAAFSIISNVSS